MCIRDSGGKNASKQQQQKKQEEARVETCPVKAMKRILRPATANELEQLEEKVLTLSPLLALLILTTFAIRPCAACANRKKLPRNEK